MPNQTNHTQRPIPPEKQSPAPQRPQTILRRISSGVDSFLSNLPLRRATPQQQTQNPTTHRPLTAPGNPSHVLTRQPIISITRPSEISLAPPQIHIPRLSEPAHPCPYDAEKYHSFPKIERSRCDFCGMRGPSRAASSQSCNECRSKSPLSHLKFSRRRAVARVDEDRIDTLSACPPARVQPYSSSSSSEEGVRIVSPERAARRIGNPPRRASLPPTHLRPPRPNNSNDDTNKSRPTSPKLHHFHCLPNHKAYPYVHKNEVAAHIAAIEAGEHSPLADVGQIMTRNRVTSFQGTDFSETVYYGRRSTSPTTTRARPTSNVVVSSIVVRGEHVRAPSRREKTRPVPRTKRSTDSDGTPMLGGVRLELKGGGAPRLRGGESGGEEKDSRSTFRREKCILLPRRLEFTKRATGSFVATTANILPTSRFPTFYHHHLLPAEPQITRLSPPSSQPTPTSAPPLILSLRGGAGSPAADQVRLPPTLFWLAGGKNRPATVKAWKESQPKKRMGGLLGLAVHGVHAGTEYGKKQEDMKSTEKKGEKVESKTNNSDTESLKSGKSHHSSKSNGSSGAKVHGNSSCKASSRSQLSGSAKREVDTAAAAAKTEGGEEKKEMAVESVAEEAASKKDLAATADTVPQGEQVASDAPREAVADGAAENAPTGNVEGGAEPEAEIKGDGNAAEAEGIKS